MKSHTSFRLKGDLVSSNYMQIHPNVVKQFSLKLINVKLIVTLREKPMRISKATLLMQKAIQIFYLLYLNE